MKKSPSRISIKVNGMTCVNCAKGIEKKLQANRLTNVSVNFSTGEVIYDSNTNKSLEEVQKIITSIGYTIDSRKKLLITKVEIYFYISLIFTLPLLLHMFVGEYHFLRDPILQFFLCLPVYCIGVLYFGKSAFNSLSSRIANMDLLIFIGSSAAYFYSIYGWILYKNSHIAHKYLFFETSATIITLVLLGNLLEKKAVKKTTSSINDLSKRQNVKTKKEINGKLIEISFKEIKKDDILIINSGDKIPTDGIIISGKCFVDESMFTGESIPNSKAINDTLIGGTIIVEGSIKLKATKTGKDTLLSKIIELVKDSQNNKPKIQKLGDKISEYFVPSVILIAILTFIFTFYYFKIPFEESLLRSIAVLVISCPCAMGLATPTAVMVGVGLAAKKGILIKGGRTLEKLASVKHLVFDKTGTLTTGEFKISKIEIKENHDEKVVKDIIYNIEKFSSHPIAKSLCRELKNFDTDLKVKEVQENKGVSISAKIDNDIYTIGSKKLNKSKIEYDLLVLKNNQLIAKINITDKIKEDTKFILKKLENDYDISLLSGDSQKKCYSIARKLNITNIYSEHTPIDKIKKIKELNTKTATAMIGDGINDAPALAKSTVGISIGNATQIAIQSSDVILLNNLNLNQLPEALLISKETLKTIKQNLFWAFSYNIIAIPIAISGLLNPMWGAFFMAFSDIIVIGNSIRLRYKKIFY
tara:strand:+ start:146 stop:2245 length:2100 start_codon:yes stop_codon:yes gene_type:complete